MSHSYVILRLVKQRQHESLHPGKRDRNYMKTVWTVFSTHISKYRESSQDVSVGSCWNSLKGALLKATKTSCGQTNVPAIHRETWW